MQQFESVAAKRSECDTAIFAFEAVLPSMHPVPDRDETVQSGGSSVPDQSEPKSMSDSDTSDDSEPFLSDLEAAASNLVFVQIH